MSCEFVENKVIAIDAAKITGESITRGIVEM
jgi:hypothetical protein